MVASQNPGELRADWIARDLYAILDQDVTYPGWEHETAENKAFYVRGFSWFRDNVINGQINITDVAPFIPQMKSLLKTRTAWMALPFKWDETFGDRQFIDAASPHRKLTPKFQKAVEVIVLCEAIADDMHSRDSSKPSGKVVYDHMRIEAAVSFIRDFDRTLIKELESKKGDFLRDLRNWTGQGTHNVFYDMADGKSVTHKLAVWTHCFLETRFPNCGVGEVDFRLNRRKRWKPTTLEDVDANISKLPQEAVNALKARRA
jgi:hypothetical protein